MGEEEDYGSFGNLATGGAVGCRSLGWTAQNRCQTTPTQEGRHCSLWRKRRSGLYSIVSIKECPYWGIVLVLKWEQGERRGCCAPGHRLHPVFPARPPPIGRPSSCPPCPSHPVPQRKFRGIVTVTSQRIKHTDSEQLTKFESLYLLGVTLWITALGGRLAVPSVADSAGASPAVASAAFSSTISISCWVLAICILA